jgi:3-hydroxymyristoyl/3-hydroxydecanoyl-(acyl carrier protein) dehydratase
MRWLLIDKIEALKPGVSAVGLKTWASEEPFFEDHFPGFPVVPGVLLMEALAQLAGKLIGYSVRQDRGDWPFPILSMMNSVKFRRFVRPDETVLLSVKIDSLREEMAGVSVRARVNGKVVAQAEQVFVFNAVPLADEADRLRVEALERAHLERLWADCPESQ